MENSISIRTDLTFKSKALNEATKKIALAVATQEKNKKEICILLYNLEKGKAYKEDGFKSLAEFAEKIGLDKSIAHKYENAGRLYANSNAKVKEFSENTDFSKLSILASADPVKVAEAIEKGDLKPNFTQEQVKEWKQKADPAKPKIEKRMCYHGIEVTVDTKGKATSLRSDFPNAIKEEVPFIKPYNWTYVKQGEEKYNVGFAVDEHGNLHFAMYTTSEYKADNTSITREEYNRLKELEAKLEALRAQGIEI